MKTLSKNITTVNRIISDYENKYLFNASEVLSLLLLLRELREYNISLTEIFDGAIQLTIGNSIYQILQTTDD